LQSQGEVREFKGKVYIVGIGPGSSELLTLRAVKALKKSEYILGHRTYLDQIRSFISDKKIIESGMGKEVERVKLAVNLAKENTVALVSGGDPSIYGIYSLFFEYITYNNILVDYEVIPGVSALSACSPLLGSPVCGDHSVVSLSDLLTPWEEIERKLRHALRGGFVVVLYNPSSKRRKSNLMRALEIIRDEIGDVTLGIVKNGWREGEFCTLVKVSELINDLDLVDMSTTIFIPSPETIIRDGRMLTPRGYSRKYMICEVDWVCGNKRDKSMGLTEKVTEHMGAKTRRAREITLKSYEIARRFVDGDDLKSEILRRCIIATGDPSIKDLIYFKGDPEVGVSAIRNSKIIVDVSMLKAGLRKRAIAMIDFADGEEETRVVSGLMNLKEEIEGSVVGIGNAPSAAMALCKIAERYKPAFIVATPVGFVSASESKEMVRCLDIPSITTVGSRGGSTICTAIINCLIDHSRL